MKKYFLRLWRVAGADNAGGLPGAHQLGNGAALPTREKNYLNQNAVNSTHWSVKTTEVLHRYNLDKAFKENPDATLEKLQTIAGTDDRRDLLYALSELNYVNADRQRQSVKRGVPKPAGQLSHPPSMPISICSQRAKRRRQAVRHPGTGGR